MWGRCQSLKSWFTWSTCRGCQPDRVLLSLDAVQTSKLIPVRTKCRSVHHTLYCDRNYNYAYWVLFWSLEELCRFSLTFFASELKFISWYECNILIEFQLCTYSSCYTVIKSAAHKQYFINKRTNIRKRIRLTLLPEINLLSLVQILLTLKNGVEMGSVGDGERCN